MNVEFKRLTDIEPSEIIALMNNPLVRRQMPLIPQTFGNKECDGFVASKEKLWAEHGYGPWAFVRNKQFLGWGGLQPENGEADLALVLHPDHWGMGKTLFKAIMDRAFGPMGLVSVTVLLPPTRKRIRGLFRLGFEEDGVVVVGEERFIRYRLNKSATASATDIPFDIASHRSMNPLRLKVALTHRLLEHELHSVVSLPIPAPASRP